MKTLLLLRHAKSDWQDANLRDFDRPLAQRGRRDAPKMGRALNEKFIQPDLILCSPAVRATQTMEQFKEAAALDLPISFEQNIYEATVGELMKIVRRLPEDKNSVLMIGHNPGFEALLRRLTGVSEHMATAALACIELPVESWADVEDGQGKLAWFMTPKTIGG
jgi:phosphohistidine phosphatase